ncbi:hypothetical protein T439DRAFT_376375 [Meredithblackwellia eburnea MCA 4105]
MDLKSSSSQKRLSTRSSFDYANPFERPESPSGSIADSGLAPSASPSAPFNPPARSKTIVFDKLPLKSDSESETSDTNVKKDDPALHREDPLDPLRRTNVFVAFLGGGLLAGGSALFIVLYVTGEPQTHDWTSASTGVLLAVLVLGCLTVIPNLIGCLLIILGGKPQPLRPPPHARGVRHCAFAALASACLYVSAAFVLWIIVHDEGSFVSFCLRNSPNETAEQCAARWDRAWTIVVSAGMCFLLHVSNGFPIYRYARGPEWGKQLQTDSIWEEGKEAVDNRFHGLSRSRTMLSRLTTDNPFNSSSEDEDDLSTLMTRTTTRGSESTGVTTTGSPPSGWKKFHPSNFGWGRSTDSQAAAKEEWMEEGRLREREREREEEMMRAPPKERFTCLCCSCFSTYGRLGDAMAADKMRRRINESQRGLPDHDLDASSPGSVAESAIPLRSLGSHKSLRVASISKKKSVNVRRTVSAPTAGRANSRRSKP